MAEPRRVQLKRTKGWKMPENTVVVSRPGKWGNPFAIGVTRHSKAGDEKVTDAAMAVKFFCEMLRYPVRGYPREATIRKELAGKNLACWCKLTDACHADILLELANSPPNHGEAE